MLTAFPLASYHQHPLFGKRSGGIRLAGASARRARRARAGGNTGGLDSEEDGASSEEEDDLDDLDDNADELPATSPQPRPSVPQLASKGIRTALDALGWTGAGGSGGGVGGQGPHSDAGIARAFWGLRKKDQRGGIRLGDDDEANPGGAAAARRQRKPLELVLPAPLVERLPAVPSSPGRGRVPPQSPRASSSPTLFDLGEEEEEQDAVELAHEFKLEDHPLGDGAPWGDAGKRGPPQVVGSVRSMQRLA